MFFPVFATFLENDGREDFIEARLSGKAEDLPPHVERYKKAGPKVALRVSVETLGIAWLISNELQRSSQLGRVGWRRKLDCE